ncbi:unnamed protein product [Mytilus coruscus]|uniref:Uncharacterized protein n=1 Tax=Mytilus coruscus TaxID=42192 RepID=A0A6J8DR91_MYTCO|nr:unnamed protein product [Mytilus coruscus]
MEVNVDDQRENVNSSENYSSSGSRCMQQTVTVILGHPLVKVSKIKDVLHGDVHINIELWDILKTIFLMLKLLQDSSNYIVKLVNIFVLFLKKEIRLFVITEKHDGINYYSCPKCEEGKYLPKSEKNRRSDSILEYIYMLRMKVLDETGSLIIILCTSEAITFFRDVEPIDLLSKESLWHELHDEMDQLCSSDRPLFELGPVKTSELKRPNPFAEFMNNSGNNDNIDAVTSTSVDEQKSYKESEQKLCGENDIGNQQMEVNVDDQRENVNSSQNYSSSGSRCMQQTVTVILGHPLVKVSKIKDVLHGDVPYKYRIMGHIEDYFPHAKTASGFLKLHCKTCKYLCPIPEKGKSDSLSLQKKHDGINYYSCPKCEEGKYLPKSEKNRRPDSILEYIYMLRMKVLDETGSLIIILCTSEAITFFRDVEPIDLLSKESLWHELRDEMDQLCSSDRPLFECCIKSYKVGQQTKHQIFDTCLV